MAISRYHSVPHSIVPLGCVALALLAALLSVRSPLSAGNPSHQDPTSQKPQAKQEGERQEEEEEQKPQFKLPGITVWGSRYRAQADRTESVVVITASDIELLRSTGTYDVFKNMPGIYVVQGLASGFGLGYRGAGPIRLRGLGRTAGGANRVRGILVETDGVPDFSITHGHPFPDVFNLDNVDRIEIIKGPSSVLHGNAMSGVINITTREPGPGFRFHAKSSGGSFGTTENLARASYGWNRGFAQVSGSVRRTDGHRLNSKFDAEDLNLKLGQHIGSHFNLTFSGGGGHFGWENPGPGGRPGGDTNFGSANLSLTARTARTMGALKLWGIYGIVNFDDGEVEPNWAFGAKAKEVLHLIPGNMLTLGFDVMDYRTRTTKAQPSFISEFAPYVFVDHEITGQFRMSGGVRYTHNEQFGDDISPEIGFVYKPVTGTGVRIRAARGFRAPNFFELDIISASANRDLDASSLWQIEVGWNQEIRFKRWGPRRLTFDLAGFYQVGDNMIRLVPDPTAPGATRFANSGVFHHGGFEGQTALFILDNLSVFGGLTHLGLEDDTALTPINTVDFGAAYAPGRFDVRLAGRFVNRLFDRDDHKDRLDDFTVLDLDFSYRLSPRYRLFVDIDNLTDQHYELLKGFPMPGVAAYGGVSLSM